MIDLQTLINKLHDNNIVPSQPIDAIENGVVHRFHISGDKDGSKNGWVIVFESKSGNKFAGQCGNWKDSSKYSISTYKDETAEQKAAAIAGAVQKMEDVLHKSNAADPQHPYLVSKKVQAHPRVRMDRGRALLIPLSYKKTITAIQRIYIDNKTGKAEKKFVQGSKAGGSYFVIDGKKERVYICEGYATAATAHELTGYMAIMSYSVSHIMQVARTAKELMPASEIVIVADNDIDTKDNPGKTKAMTAAKALQCKIVISNTKGDINDIVSIYNKVAVAKRILKNPLLPEELEGDGIPKDYILGDDAVYKIEHRNKMDVSIPIAESAIRVTAMTRDYSDDEWGREVAVTTPEGKVHTIILPADTLTSRSQKAIARLARAGAIILSEADVTKYIIRCRPNQMYRAAVTLGWLGNKCSHFVMPHDTIGGGEIVKYQTPLEHTDNPYSIRGDTAQWRDNVSAYAVNNPVVQLAIAMSFAAPLVRVLQIATGDQVETFGVHFYGEGTLGKSTVARISSSVWGKGDKDGHMHTWGNTTVGFEGLATLHNHNLLVLDEVGEFGKPSELQKIIFMLVGGQTKGRGRQDGTLQSMRHWGVLFLSTGNSSISELVRMSGQQAFLAHKGGQDTRLIEIAFDSERNKIIDDTGDTGGGHAYATHMRDAANSYYGAVGVAFIEKLITEQADILHKWELYQQKDIDNVPMNPQHKRVYDHLQVVGFAGELATAWGFTGWNVGDSKKASHHIFNLWRADHKGISAERTEVIARVAMILENRAHDFQSNTNENIRNRLGWRWFIDNAGKKLNPLKSSEDPKPVQDGQQKEVYSISIKAQYDTSLVGYFITPEIFKDIFCASIDVKTVIGWLYAEGMAISTRAASHHFPSSGSKRYYILHPKDEKEPKIVE